jgi:uncharacterized protein (TIGR03066 family)
MRVDLSILRVFVICSLCLVFLNGCSSHTRSVVGDWDITGGPSAAVMSFQAHGNFKTEASMRGRHSSVTGQYELQGDKVVFKMPARTATIRWNSDNEMVMTGDDGVAMTLKRR